MPILDRVRSLFGVENVSPMQPLEPMIAGPDAGLSISGAQYEEGLAQAAEMEGLDPGDDLDEQNDPNDFYSRATSVSEGDWQSFSPGEEIKVSYGTTDKGHHYLVEHSVQGGDTEEDWSKAYPTRALAQEAAGYVSDSVINGPDVANSPWENERKSILLDNNFPVGTMEEKLATLGPDPEMQGSASDLEQETVAGSARGAWEQEVQTINQSTTITDQDKKQLIDDLGPAPAVTQEEKEYAIERGDTSADLGRNKEVSIEADAPEKGVGFTQEMAPEDREKVSHEPEHDLEMDF